MSKRGSDTQQNQLISKRVKSYEIEDKLGLDTSSAQQVTLSKNKDNNNQLVRNIQRTSKLSAPIIKLEGCHNEEITSVKFDLTGNFLVATSTDKSISLWKTYTDNSNFGFIPHAHKEAITALALSQKSPSSPVIVTASADSTIGLWNSSTGKLIRRLREHSDVVNAISLSKNPANELLASAGDDNKVCIWDLHSKHPLHIINWHSPVITIEWADDGSTIFIGGLDNEIHVRDEFICTIIF